MIPRRTFLKVAAVGAASAALNEPSGAQTRRARAGLKLGVASYSLRHFPAAQAIAITKELRTPYINLKSMHLPYESTPGEIAALRNEIAKAGLQIVGGGMITFDVDTDEGVQKYFDYARAAGMPVIVSTCRPPVLPRIEKFAKRYDIKVAMHNHGPEDHDFPSPYDALKAVRNMDSRIGLCIDVGHTARTGTDVVKAVADAGSRLLDMHMKDLRDLKVKESQCIVGEGKIPVAELFRQLERMGYDGCVNLEYEIDENDPLPGMKQSFAYMRGVLAGLA